MLNKVILIGRLVADPEIKWTPSGIPVTSMTLAVDRPMSSEARQAGQEKQADFIDLSAWRQTAEYASNYLSKGRLVAVEGRLQIRQYVAQDGTHRRAAEVIVDRLQSLERPRDGQGDGDDGYHRASSGATSRSSYDRESAGAGRDGGQYRPAITTGGPAVGGSAIAALEPDGDAIADGTDPFADE